MDKISSLNLSFDRVFIQIIIPGFTAIIAWAIIFFNHFTYERDFLLKNPSVLLALMAVICIISGFTLENFGSFIEVNLYDKWNLKKDPDYMAIWDKFLLIQYEKCEPIGHRYLRNVLIRMKFELSFALALILLWIGLFCLDIKKNIIQSCMMEIALLVVLPPILIAYLIFYEGYSSSKVLATTRKLLVNKYNP